MIWRLLLSTYGIVWRVFSQMFVDADNLILIGYDYKVAKIIANGMYISSIIC